MLSVFSFLGRMEVGVDEVVSSCYCSGFGSGAEGLVWSLKTIWTQSRRDEVLACDS